MIMDMTALLSACHMRCEINKQYKSRNFTLIVPQAGNEKEMLFSTAIQVAIIAVKGNFVNCKRRKIK